jgi:hypothetical protein
MRTAGNWPEIPVDDWVDTRDTFQLWTQVVGKVLLANTPTVNHWWNAALHLTGRGLTTGPIPYGARGFEMAFDLVEHHLTIAVTDGSARTIPLEPRTTADFYRTVMAELDELDLTTRIWPMPVEIPGAIPLDTDTTHASYDAAAVNRFWRALIQMERVLEQFRARFVGKVSPVHLFWGALDLAVTRFSGRPAPPHPGVAPNCGPHVMREAYSHEVSSAGYWPGPSGREREDGPGGSEGVFYSYAYPEPDGFRTRPVEPEAAHWDDALGEFVLPYTAVRTAADPDAVLLAFLQSSYEAAADLAGWDRAALERAGAGAVP